MNKGIRILFLLFAWMAVADVPVLFKSQPLYDGQVVYLASVQPNEAPQVSQYRLQLFYSVTNVQWQPVGSAISVRQTNLAGMLVGTFDGGVRTLPGVSEGQHVDMMILVFDRRICATWQLAMDKLTSTGNGGGAGTSGAFDYAYSAGTTTSNLMVNLPPIAMNSSSCSFWSQLPDQARDCDEDGVLYLPEYSEGGDFALTLSAQKTPGSPVGLTLGTLTRDWAKPGFSYVPKPGVYGEDFAYQYRQGGFCDPPSWVATKLTLRVRPSPKRPYLVTTTQGVKLRGLAGQRYRIERSTSLAGWEPWGEVVGNYSEVELSEDLVEPGTTQFIRAVILDP